MTDIDTVRLIVADPAQFDRAEAAGDGVSTQFPLPNAPVVAGTVSVWVDNVPTITFTLDPRLGMVTLTAPPADGVLVVVTYQWSILLDADIDSFLTLEGGDIRLAAAQALDTIASSEVMVQKRITILDLQTDGPATARELRAHAKALREQAPVSGEQDGLVDYAELALPPFGDRDYYLNELRRAGDL